MKWRDRLAIKIMLWIVEFLLGDNITINLKNDLRNIKTSINITGKNLAEDE